MFIRVHKLVHVFYVFEMVRFSFTITDLRFYYLMLTYRIHREGRPIRGIEQIYLYPSPILKMEIAAIITPWASFPGHLALSSRGLCKPFADKLNHWRLCLGTFPRGKNITVMVESYTNASQFFLFQFEIYWLSLPLLSLLWYTWWAPDLGWVTGIMDFQRDWDLVSRSPLYIIVKIRHIIRLEVIIVAKLY